MDLKIRLMFSTPGKPQGRGRIERFFRTVNEMFVCELDGYIKRKRHKPSLSLERSRRSGAGQPRHWAGLESDTPNNSETLRQIAIKATGMPFSKPAA